MARGRRKVEAKDYDALIQNTEETIAQLTIDLKTAKFDLKKLKKDKAAYEKQKEEEEQLERAKKVADMIAKSGKSLDEIEAFLSRK